MDTPFGAPIPQLRIQKAPPMSRKSKTGDVLAFPAGVTAPAPVQQTVSLDIGINPFLFSVGDLKQILERFPDDLSVRIGFLTECQKRPDVYMLTRMVAATIDDESMNEAGKVVKTKVPALLFTFDESVTSDLIEGPHDGDLPPPPLIEAQRRGKRSA